MLRLLTFLLMVLSMPTQAGDYFPPDYKVFAFHEGDLLASKRGDGKFAVNKVLKVDRIDVKAGSSISIQGKTFVAPEDDYLLIVSAAYGEAEFNTLEEAGVAAQTGTWKVKVSHVPNRPPGAAAGQVKVGFAPVTAAELGGYEAWRAAFKKGEAGVF